MRSDKAGKIFEARVVGMEHWHMAISTDPECPYAATVSINDGVHYGIPREGFASWAMTTVENIMQISDQLGIKVGYDAD